MTRVPLPDRRQNVIRSTVFDGKTYTLCIGYDPDGAPREVFCDGHKTGSTMQAFIADTCVIVSIALQHGITPSELAHSLGKTPAWRDGAETEDHASPVGLIVEALL